MKISDRILYMNLDESISYSYQFLVIKVSSDIHDVTSNKKYKYLWFLINKVKKLGKWMKLLS